VTLQVTKYANGSVKTQRRIEFGINRGKFYYELGFMIPVTFGGDRRISTTPIANSGVSSLVATSDAAWALGLGIIIYPLGVHNTLMEDQRRWYWRYASPLGLGFGTNLYSSHAAFREAFFTLNYRFAYGVVAGVGFTAAQGEFLRPNYAAGDLLPAGVPLSDVTDTRYDFRPNLTLTLSADVIRGFFELISSVKSAPSESGAPKTKPHY
jgi:hypothetical protein